MRGQIISKGLTPTVIVYAANDVKWEIPMFRAQLLKLKEQDLVEAIKFENTFIKTLVYFKFCGVKLDITRWKNKMAKDFKALKEKEKILNDWVLNFFNKNKINKKNFIKTEIPIRKHTF